jgi:hypothetical protein
MKKVHVGMAHAEEVEQLRKDVDAYSIALLTRDDFKPTLDNKIEARFLDLVQDMSGMSIRRSRRVKSCIVFRQTRDG